LEIQVLRDRGQGIGILVSNQPKETKAAYSLKEPGEVCVRLCVGCAHCFHFIDFKLRNFYLHAYMVS
jgi:hypothetical protein